MSQKRIRQAPPAEGIRFDKWLVIGTSTKPYSVRCRCDCGTEKDIRYRHLYSGHTRSCVPCSGDKVAKAKTKHGCNRRKAGRSPTYHSWSMMIQRCTNPNLPRYPDYGGRGIRVCEAWLSFQNFLSDMGERPSRFYSIDRIDNDGHYQPGNCRWATVKEQNSNQRPRRSKRN